MPTGIHPELGWRYKVMNLFSATFHIFTNAGSKLKGRINQQSSVPIFAKKSGPSLNGIDISNNRASNFVISLQTFRQCNDIDVDH